MNESNIKKLLGKRVKYLRTLSGISQEKLAEKVGLSTKTISYIENGKNSISLNKLPLLAEGLGVPVYKLFIPSDASNNKELLNELINSATDKEINIITDIVKAVLSLR